MKHFGNKTQHKSEATIENATLILEREQLHLSILVRDVANGGTAIYHTADIVNNVLHLMKLFKVTDISQVRSRKVIAYWSSPSGSPLLTGFEPAME